MSPRALCLCLLLGLLAAEPGRAIAEERGSQRPPASEKSAPIPRRGDGLGDALPEDALLRLGTLRLRHRFQIYTLAYAPDGQSLASGGDDGLRVWDLPSCKERFHLEERIGSLYALAYSPDGKRLAGTVSADFTVGIWDAVTGKELLRLPRHTNGACSISFSRDGKKLATGDTWGNARVWDAATGKLLHQIKDRVAERAVHTYFMPDGKAIATLDSRGFLVHDLVTQKVLYSFSDFTGPSVFSPDGKLLARGDARYATKEPIRLHDTARGKELGKLEGHTDGILALAFTPDGKRLISPSRDNTVRLWDVASRKELRRYRGHNDWNQAPLCISADGTTLAAGSHEGAVRLWDVASAKPLHPTARHDVRVADIAFSPDGKTLATADISAVRLWDETGKLLHKLKTAEMGQVGRHPVRLVFSPDGRSLGVGLDGGTALLWDTATGKRKRTFTGHAFALSSDGKLIAASASRQETCVILAEMETGKEVWRRTDARVGPCCLGFAPDGKTVIAGISGPQGAELVVWNTVTGKEIRRIDKAPVWSMRMTLCPDGRIALSPSVVNTLHVWDTATGKELRAFEGLSGALSPDGKLLAKETAPGGVVQVLEVATGKERCRFGRHQSSLFALTFSADGRTLATGSADTTALLWDVTGRRDGSLRPVELSPARIQELWDGLGDTNARQAHRRIWEMVAGGKQAVAFLARRMRVVQCDEKRIAGLIAELDSEEFKVREKARAELDWLDALAVPAMRRTLEGGPTLETRRRLQPMLAEIEARRPGAEWLRHWRALEVLEQIGSVEARSVLERIGHGASEASLTLEARAALARLVRR